jgi:hypothetical protein
MRAILATGLILLASPALAGPQSFGLYNTGISDGTVSQGGWSNGAPVALDSNWTYQTVSGYVTSDSGSAIISNEAQGYWVDTYNNGGLSNWITADTYFPNGFFPGTSPGYSTVAFSESFTLTAYQAASFNIQGLVAADNDLAGVAVNNILTGITVGNALGNGADGSSYAQLHAFTIEPGDFVAGVNTITFYVYNAGGYGDPNPEGLNVQWTAAYVPEAPSFLLLLVGLTAVTLSARRRTKV